MRTQVAIIGAGPAGLLLAHLLHLHGIESVVIEKQSRAYVETRLRAGLLEWAVVELFKKIGLGERLQAQGMVHQGFQLVLDGHVHRIDLADLTNGKDVTIYGQTELVKDMIAARLKAGLPLLFESENVRLEKIETERPTVLFDQNGQGHEIHCDFIAGCDGFHGVSRPSLPKGATQQFSQTYPIAWLGVLAQAPVFTKELVYAVHERGFSLFSMRGPELTRAYLQCRVGDSLDNWSDERIWQELHIRLEADNGQKLNEGPILSKSMIALRSFVIEPMHFGRLFLAGDAAHIVPPSAAKGLNSAAADSVTLFRALRSFYQSGCTDQLAQYSSNCLKHIWPQQHISWRMTHLLHHFAEKSLLEQRMQQTELRNLIQVRSAAVHFAQFYVGLPWADAILNI